MLPKKLKFLASLQLAVVILIAIAAISAAGTFYESLYNASYAKLVVYQSYWMWVIQGALAINLAAVMLDRWPWKKRHTPFLLAHIGIIIVLMGSLLTYFQGIDGLMVLPIGSQNRYVEVDDKDFSVYSSFDGNKFTTLFSEEVNFYKNPPQEKHQTYKITSQDEVKLLDYYIFAEAISRIESSENKSDGPALRFFVEGSRAKESGWLLANKIFKEDSTQMGPAQIKLLLEPPQKNTLSGNQMAFFPLEETQKIGYHLSNKEGLSAGELKVGQVLDTGWMDFKIRVVTYKRHASRGNHFENLDYPHALSTEALKFSFQGKDYWLALNQPLKIFDKDKVYVFKYGSKRVDIGFNMKLEDFKVGRYQGTMRASSYESVVSVAGQKHNISMNEPLKKNGLTFYQSSFQQDEMGRPTHSVLSVNKDPGRFLKYLGCFLVALGTFFLFYFKRFGMTWRFF